MVLQVPFIKLLLLLISGFLLLPEAHDHPEGVFMCEGHSQVQVTIHTNHLQQHKTLTYATTTTGSIQARIIGLIQGDMVTD